MVQENGNGTGIGIGVGGFADYCLPTDGRNSLATNNND